MKCNKIVPWSSRKQILLNSEQHLYRFNGKRWEMKLKSRHKFLIGSKAQLQIIPMLKK